MTKYPKTPRDYAGLFMLKKGAVMGQKIDAGDVQDWMAEFAEGWIRRAHCAEAERNAWKAAAEKAYGTDVALIKP